MDDGNADRELVDQYCTALPTLPFRTLDLQPISNLTFLFFLSRVLRLIVSAALLRTFHETREVEYRAHHRLRL